MDAALMTSNTIDSYKRARAYIHILRFSFNSGITYELSTPSQWKIYCSPIFQFSKVNFSTAMLIKIKKIHFKFFKNFIP